MKRLLLPEWRRLWVFATGYLIPLICSRWSPRYSSKWTFWSASLQSTGFWGLICTSSRKTLVRNKGWGNQLTASIAQAATVWSNSLCFITRSCPNTLLTSSRLQSSMRWVWWRNIWKSRLTPSWASCRPRSWLSPNNAAGWLAWWPARGKQKRSIEWLRRNTRPAGLSSNRTDISIYGLQDLPNFN